VKFLAARSVFDKKKSEKMCHCHTEKHEDIGAWLYEMLKSHCIPWLFSAECQEGQVNLQLNC
jgi:hypothetical protein